MMKVLLKLPYKVEYSSLSLLKGVPAVTLSGYLETRNMSPIFFPY